MPDNPSGPYYYIPLRKNPEFVGRESILQRLRAMLFEQNSTLKAAITGLGGAGKNQIALHLSYWVKERLPDFSVFWVRASSKEDFERDMAVLAEKLHIPVSSNNQDPKVLVGQCLNSDKSGKWFLVVDNADDKQHVLDGGIMDYLPESNTGRILFTTRFRHIVQDTVGRNVIEVGEMDPSNATKLCMSLIPDSLGDETAQGELLGEPAYLPLAIAQAAAYINRNQTAFKRYLALLRQSTQDANYLLSEGFRDNYGGRKNHAVVTTWLVSFEKICQSSSPAAGLATELLSFMSLIEPKAIPRSTFAMSREGRSI